MLRPAILAALSLAALLPACDEALSPRTELSANRARWSSAGPTTYSYELQVICFCLPEYVQPVRITVREGAVEEVVSASTGGPLSPAEAALFQITVDSLFDWLQTASGTADQVRVTYDPALGYPRNAWIDYLAAAADDEIGFTTRLLAP